LIIDNSNFIESTEPGSNTKEPFIPAWILIQKDALSNWHPSIPPKKYIATAFASMVCAISKSLGDLPTILLLFYQ
jgi:hypothetical protein